MEIPLKPLINTRAYKYAGQDAEKPIQKQLIGN